MEFKNRLDDFPQVVEHLLEMYGLTEYDTDTGAMRLVEQVSGALGEKTRDESMTHILKTIRRFAPHADKLDRKILQFGIACYRHASHGVKVSLEEIFDSESELVKGYTRWEFAVMGVERRPLNRREQAQVGRICNALLRKYGIMDENSGLSRKFMLTFYGGADTDHADGVEFVLDVIRKHAGPEPTDEEVKLMGMAILSSMPKEAREDIEFRLYDMLDPDELRGIMRRDGA